MNDLLATLRACAEPTRLRLLSLAATGAFCVVELTEILGQSQPRLSRHLRLLCEAGLLERMREGAHVWFALPGGEAGGFARALLARVPEGDPDIVADRRQATRVLAERARLASEKFRRDGVAWDEMRALDLPAAAIEAALLRLLPARLGSVLDIGTGSGRLLELLASRAECLLGVDADRGMLALARTRLAQAGVRQASVRLGDMYRLPLGDRSVDTVLIHMVLHHAEEPLSVLAEAARVLRPGGLLVVVELLAHAGGEATRRLAHRWPGFDATALAALLEESGLAVCEVARVEGALPVGLVAARAAAVLPAPVFVPVFSEA